MGGPLALESSKPLTLPCFVNLWRLSGVQGMVNLSGLWKADGVKKPELTDVGWLGPRDEDEMDRASHRFGKCSECHETICVEKAVTDGPSMGKSSNARNSRSLHRLNWGS